MNHRDNNFNLMRVIAALSVIYSHSFALTSGSGRTEPLHELLGMSLGTVAVSVFFVVSGFLVTGSLLSKERVGDFVMARARRIYPGLWVALVLTVLVLGPIATTRSVADYLTDPKTRFYLAKNATLVFGFADGLPGVFESLPLPRAVNGSLWTLPIEVRLYLVLALLFGVLRLISKGQAQQWMRAFVTVIAFALFVRICLQGTAASYETRFAALFFGGGLLQAHRSKIRLSGALAAIGVGMLAATAWIGHYSFLVAFSLVSIYVVVYLAFAPVPILQAYNRAGDYSYGLYIYGFPVQQAILSLMPGVNPGALFLASVVVALPLAALSWHLVESRFLARRSTRSPASLSAGPNARNAANSHVDRTP